MIISICLVCLPAPGRGGTTQAARTPRAGAGPLRRPPGAPPTVTPPHANIYHCTPLPQEPRHKQNATVRSPGALQRYPLSFFAHTSWPSVHSPNLRRSESRIATPLGRSLVQLARVGSIKCAGCPSASLSCRAVSSTQKRRSRSCSCSFAPPWTPPRPCSRPGRASP